jgi:hypothetical protein
MAAALIAGAEAIVVRMEHLPASRINSVGLGEKVRFLLERVRPLAALRGRAVEILQFGPALAKLKCVLCSVDKFVQSISCLVPGSAEEGYHSEVVRVMLEIDSCIEEIETSLGHRLELPHQEEVFCNTLQVAFDSRSLTVLAPSHEWVDGIHTTVGRFDSIRCAPSSPHNSDGLDGDGGSADVRGDEQATGAVLLCESNFHKAEICHDPELQTTPNICAAATAKLVKSCAAFVFAPSVPSLRSCTSSGKAPAAAMEVWFCAFL